MLNCDFSNISVEFHKFLSVAFSPFGALYEAVALVLANDVDFAAECDSDESCCVFPFHGVVLFLGVFLKDGPPLREFGNYFCGSWGSSSPSSPWAQALSSLRSWMMIGMKKVIIRSSIAI